MNDTLGDLEKPGTGGEQQRGGQQGISIRQATNKDFATIIHIAHHTWPATFSNILTPAQINYMLDMMYSPAALQEQVQQKGHTFLLALEAEDCLGFASYQLNYHGESLTKIHKIYILPNTQGKGVGKALIQAVAAIAHQRGNTLLTLNVNRYNPAVQFYQRIGFSIVGEEDIDIGNGFLMQDFIMHKQI